MTTDRYDEAKELLTLRAEYRPGEPEYDRLRGRVILLCLPLAEHIARRFSGRGEPYDDLLQVARVGLINAIDRFDAGAGSDLLSYAVPTVMGEVRRHFRDRSPVIRIPRRSRELSARVAAARDELSQRFQRTPVVAEVARYLDVTVAQVRKAGDDCAAGAAVSLDEPWPGDPDGAARIDRIACEETGYGHVDNGLELQPALESLPARERRILGLRYIDLKSQSEIASEVGISQMHVSRLLRRSLADLRQVLAAPSAA